VVKKVGEDMSSAFFKYEVMWSPRFIKWLVNGKVVHTTSGIAGVTIPYTAGNQMLILRPLSKCYEGPAAFEIASLAYELPSKESLNAYSSRSLL